MGGPELQRTRRFRPKDLVNGFREQAVLWRPNPARTGEGLDARRGRPAVGFVLILAVPPSSSRCCRYRGGPWAGRLARPYCRRDIVNAIRYLTHNGPVWRAVPTVLPHWRTVYHYERTWQETGATRRMHDHLRAAVRVLARRDPQPTAAIIDSQSAKAAGTAQRQPRLRRRKENRGQEEAPRCRRDGPPVACRDHHRLGPGPRRRPPAAVAAGRGLPHHHPHLSVRCLSLLNTPHDHASTTLAYENAALAFGIPAVLSG